MWDVPFFFRLPTSIKQDQQGFNTDMPVSVTGLRFPLKVQPRPHRWFMILMKSAK
jgi:hypothetical protein